MKIIEKSNRNKKNNEKWDWKICCSQENIITGYCLK